MSRWVVVLALFGTLTGATYHEIGSGATFLVRAAVNDPIDSGTIQEERSSVQVGDRTVSLLVLRPRAGFQRTILLAHGVHYLGTKDERFLEFGQRLCEAGFAVVAPDLEDLMSYDLQGRSLEDLEAAGEWVLDQPDLAASNGDGKIAVMGISFGGGMALSAAARPRLAGKVSAVFSFGGHGDLDRTISYLVTGDADAAQGTKAGSPHVYGQAVLMRKLAERLVPTEDLDAFRQALDIYLQGREDEAVPSLGEGSRRAKELIQYCLDRRSEELAEILRPLIVKGEFDRILSPLHGEVPSCPIFLLHGAQDNVVPPSEARAVEKWAEGKTEVNSVVTSQVIHVEFSDEIPSPLDIWEIASLLTDFMNS